MRHELKNKFVYQIIVSGTQVLLPLLSYPYITRVLGPNNLGKINYVDFLCQVFIILAGFGIPWYAVREIAVIKNNISKRTTLTTEIFLINICFGLVAILLFILFCLQDWQNNSPLYLLAVFNILLSTCTFDWYIQGTEAFKYAAIRTLVIRTAMLIAFFLLVKSSKDYIVYYAIFTASGLLLSFTNIYKLLKENVFQFEELHLKRHLKPLWHFFLTSSAISIYIYFDTIILKQITHDDEAVGLYTLALKTVKIFLLIVLSLGTVLLPRFSALAGTGNIETMSRQLNKLLQFIIVITIPIGTGIIILAPEIINVIAGEKFAPAVPLLRILALLPLVIGLSNLFCFQTLIPFNLEKKFLSVTFIGCIISIATNFLLIPYLNAAGAALANMLTEIIITFLSGTYAYRVIKFQVNANAIFQTIITCTLFLPITIACRNLFSSPIIILCIAVILCSMIYFSLQLFVFKNSIFTEIKNYLFSILKFQASNN